MTFYHAMRDPIVFESIESTSSPAFDSFYDIYETCFPIAGEREPAEAFAQVLAMNTDRDIQSRFGRYHESVHAIRAGAGGPVLGGHVFSVATSPVHVAHGMPCTIQGIYTFLHPDARGLVPMHRIVEFMRGAAHRTLGLDPESVPAATPIFIEVNDPARMDPGDIALDTAMSGISPERRYRFWLRKGFAPLAFDYIQPGLKAGDPPLTYLDLMSTRDRIPSAVMTQHLRSFYSISCMKGRDAESDPAVRALFEALARMEVVVFANAAADGDGMRPSTGTGLAP